MLGHDVPCSHLDIVDFETPQYSARFSCEFPFFARSFFYTSEICNLFFSSIVAPFFSTLNHFQP